MNKYVNKVGNTLECILEWKSKGLSDKLINPCDDTLPPTIEYTCDRM